MATSVVPALIDALLALANANLTDVLVLDGYGQTDDPGDFLMIGIEDPDSDGAGFSADARQEWANANYTARDETGDITCVALSWNGDGDAKLARDTAYGITSALEDALRLTPSLGVEGLLWTGFGSTTQLSQAQGTGGASALLIFRISFRARI